MPKGYVYPETIAKEQGKAIARGIVLRNIEPLVEAQIKNAMGLKYLIVRNRMTGKFEKVSKEQMDALLANPDSSSTLEFIEVWDKDPNVAAFTDLLNRAIGKPVEEIQAAVSIDVALDTMIRQRFTRVA
jgi:hypothetical protein